MSSTWGGIHQSHMELYSDWTKFILLHMVNKCSIQDHSYLLEAEDQNWVFDLLADFIAGLLIRSWSVDSSEWMIFHNSHDVSCHLDHQWSTRSQWCLKCRHQDGSMRCPQQRRRLIRLLMNKICLWWAQANYHLWWSLSLFECPRKPFYPLHFQNIHGATIRP